MSNNILDHLDGLIKRASAKKQEELQKEAEGGISAKLDNAEDGTVPAATGEQASSQVSEQNKTYADNMVDTGGKDNQAGESVSASTDGATAVSPSGQDGTDGAELAKGGVGEADNGPEDTDSPDNSGFESGAFKGAAAEARKLASELRKTAEELLSPLDRFLVKSARATDDEAIRKVAMEMPDDELAGSAADTLMEQIQSGQLTDEEAAQILQEAVDAGAISEEDIAGAAAAMGGEMGGGEEMMAEEAPLPGGGKEELMAAKLAAADIGPDDSRYTEKLAHFYPAEVAAGYNFAMKLAEEMAGETEEEEETEEEGEGKEKPKVEIEVESEGEEGEEGEGGEEAAPEVPEQPMEAGMGEMPAPPLEQMADLGPIAPQGGEEEAALQAVQNELGLDPEQLAQLMAAPVPEEAKVAMDKVASALADLPYATRARTIILNKVAALRQ